MKFTKTSIQEQKKLIHYLIGNGLGEGHKVENGSLVNVYDKSKCIKHLQVKIKKHSRDARYNKFVPQWEEFIKVLHDIS